MTTLEMQAMEQHLETQRQLKIIRKTLIESHVTICENDDCGLSFVAMYNENGYPLCPCCDEDKIDAYKTRHLRGLIAS